MNKPLHCIKIISLIFAFFTISAQEHVSHDVADVFYDTDLLGKLSDFSMNVLHMQDIEEWNSLAQDVKNSFNEKPTDAQLYNRLKAFYEAKQPRLYPYFLYQSLKRQQALLGKQTLNLIIDAKKINGYVEIGSPCRHADYIDQYIPLSGMRYAIHDHAAITDVLESKTPSLSRLFVTYDRMIPLHDYDPISAHDISDQSVDMVVCFIGLHHIPTEKIDPFVESIKRILRPGGVFLLRDHDAYNQDVFKLACAAHSVFNAIVAQSSSAQEAEEIRNFKPLSFWIEILEKHGFKIGEERILQQGDPTLNTLISCTKLMTSQDLLFKKLQSQPDYTRSAHQTFLTTPEWFNVDCSQSYGAFLEETPWYEFPYIESIQSYWYVFMNSLRQARTKNSWYEICIAGDYFSTCLFIGLFMTVEYTVKALIAAPVAYLSRQSYDTTITVVAKNLSQEALRRLPSAVVVQEEYESMHVLLVPRYKIFQQTLRSIAASKGDIVEIGGQRMIQVKIRSMENDTLDKALKWAQLHGAQLDFTWKVPAQNYMYGSLVVPVNQLSCLIEQAQFYNFTLAYIHDF